jgi:hypothetical protein
MGVAAMVDANAPLWAPRRRLSERGRDGREAPSD